MVLDSQGLWTPACSDWAEDDAVEATPWKAVRSSQKTVQAGDTTALLLGAKLQIHVILRFYLDVAVALGVDSDFKLIVQDSLVSKSPQLLT